MFPFTDVISCKYTCIFFSLWNNTFDLIRYQYNSEMHCGVYMCVAVNNAVARYKGAQDAFQKHRGWHWDGRRAGKRGQQMGCPISSCPFSYGQLPLSGTLSGPLYSPESTEQTCLPFSIFLKLICSEGKRGLIFTPQYNNYLHPLYDSTDLLIVILSLFLLMLSSYIW